MNNSEYFAIFLVDYLYYIPQFMPLAKLMKERNKKILFVIPKKSYKDIIDTERLLREACEENNIDYLFFDDDILNKIYTRFLICGGNNYPETNIKFGKSALIIHGVGTKKACFTEEKNNYNIRFLEGEFRIQRLKELYPEYKGILANVGFSKLDDVINMTKEEKNKTLEKINLDVNKKTILYAPTFYPGSLEKMSNNFPKDFAEYNLIIKPHFFTYLRKRYRCQRKKLEMWSKYPNVYIAGVEDYNIAPFYAVSDIMVSDESSVIFEYAALDKPVICNRFIKLRLSYRLFGKRKFKRRMDNEMNKFRDIGENVFKYKNLKSTVDGELTYPERYKAKREEYTRLLIGPTDGKVCERMMDILEKN